MIPRQNEEERVICSCCGDLCEPQDVLFHSQYSAEDEGPICVDCELEQMEDSIDMWEQ